MIHDDEEALICDFAETYHIYDYRSLPLSLASTLAAGLRDTSRIITKTTEAKASTTNTLLAMIADHLAVIRNLLGDKKEFLSVTKALYQIDEVKEKSGPIGFASGTDFMAAWQRINED